MRRLAREGSFRCVLATSSLRYTAHVRAWDAQEAAELFVLELRAGGVEEEGTIEVQLLDGARRTVVYQPTSSGTVTPLGCGLN